MSATTDSDHSDDPDDDHSSTEKFRYGCPYCQESYSKEVHTRIHVTRSTDSDHLNHNGMMPETEIEQLDDGEVIDTLCRRPREVDVSTLTINDFPGSLPDHHKHILLTAAQNPSENTYTALADAANQHLTQQGFEKVSYSTVRRVIRAFYRPQEVDSEPSESKDLEQLTDLTTKQQAIVISRLVHPDASLSTIASKVRSAESYPAQVIKRTESVISRLETAIEEGTPPQEVISDALDTDDITALRKRDLLTDIDIELPEAGDKEPSSSEQWGDPKGTTEGLTASPTLPEEYQNEQTPATNASSEPVHSSDESASSSTNTADENKTASLAISRSDIEQLRDRMAFVREIFSRIESDHPEFDLVESIAAQIEQSCEDFLEH